MEKFSAGKMSAPKSPTTKTSALKSPITEPSALKTLLTQSPQLKKLFKNPDSENCSEPPNMKNMCKVQELESLCKSSKLTKSPDLENMSEFSNLLKDTNALEPENNTSNVSEQEKISNLSELEKIENAHALSCNNPGACITMCAITYTLARKKTLAAKRQRRAAVVVPACFTNDDPTSRQDFQFDRKKQMRALDRLRKSFCMTKLVIGTFEMTESGKFDQFLVAIGTKRRTVNMVDRAAVKICIKQVGWFFTAATHSDGLFSMLN